MPAGIIRVRSREPATVGGSTREESNEHEMKEEEKEENDIL